MNPAELTERELAAEASEPQLATEAPARLPEHVHNVLQLQRTVGNASVAQRLAGSASAPAECLGDAPSALPEDGAVSRSLARTVAARRAAPAGIKEPDPSAEAAVASIASVATAAPLAAPAAEAVPTAVAPTAPAEAAPAAVPAEPAPGAAVPAESAPGATGTKEPVVATPTITSETTFSAPDGSPKTRDTVGVGEETTFTGSAAGTWKASSGKPATGASGAKFVWTAPDRAATVTIELTVGKEKATKTMTVLEPTDIFGTKIGSDFTFPAGRQGAGMKLTFNYNPMKVSFGNVFAREVSGDASNVTGYFSSYSSADLHHDSGDTFTRIAADNKDTAPDTASFSGYPSPWTAGGFDWVIPNKFKTVSEAGDGKEFTKVTQAFRIDGPPDAGQSTVRKAGVTAGPRKP